MIDKTNPQHLGVIWLDAVRAFVATAPAGRAERVTIERGSDSDATYLLRVARQVGACTRLVVMGPDAAKLAFEREFVSLYHEPDRLLDVSRQIAPDLDALLRRFNRLDAPAA